MLLLGTCLAQTQVDLRVQAKGDIMSTRLGDLSVRQISGTQISIGGNCQVATPCVLGLGNTLYRFTTGGLATLSGPAIEGFVAIYVSEEGVITVAYPSGIAGLSVACSGCVAVPQTSPTTPPSSFALAQVTFGNVGGVVQWRTITDERALLGKVGLYNVQPGSDGGVRVACVGGSCDLDLDNTLTSTLAGENNFTGNNRFGAGIEGFDYLLENDTSTGTTDQRLVKLTAAGTAIRAAAAEQEPILGITLSGGGNSGSARVRFAGRSTCTFENTAVAGNWVQPGQTSSGLCRDAGASLPASGPVVGRVLTSGTGDQIVLLNPQPAPVNRFTDRVANTTVTLSATEANLSSTTVPPLPEGRCFRYSLFWTKLGTTAPASYNLYYGAAQLALAPETATAGHIDGFVCNTIGQTQQILSASSVTGTGSQVATGTGAVDATLPRTLRLAGTGDDAVRADLWIVEIVQ